MFLKKPFVLGGIELPSNIFYAPLAGCSDFAFRKMSAKFKPGLMFCEMVKMDALIRNDEGTFRMLEFSKDMHPIGGQICGSKPEIAGSCAKIIEDLGFDTVDLNCGCPVDKITKDGSGSGMLKNPNRIGDVIANMVASVKIPVTVKIRAGWDDDSINAASITEIAEKAGAKAICIHGRTRSQGYRGPANWDHIKACKEAASSIHVIGNGDLYSPCDVKRMFEYTGCDAVLIARGTMGHPWICEDVVNFLEGKEVKTRSFRDNFEVLLEHFEEMKKYDSERRILVGMRRISCWYIKNSFKAREFREVLSHAKSIGEIEECLKVIKENYENAAFVEGFEEKEENFDESCCIS
jgi:tRNA-dihydrouridine synthase B